MNGPLRGEYWTAAFKNIETLKEIDAQRIADQTDDTNNINLICAFEWKQFPGKLIKKFKARCCVRGQQQLEGISFFEMDAPVVQWATVMRMMMIMEIILKLKSKQGDVTYTFCIC